MPMLRARRFSPSVLAVLGATLLLACLALGGAAAGTTFAGTPLSGGLLTYALQTEPTGIEPLTAADFEGQEVCQALFWGLTRDQLQPDGTLAVVPCVATSWDVNTKATVFTFHLRHSVMFAAPVSREVHAQDFVAAWDRATDPANNSWVSYVLAPIQGCNDAGQQTNPAKGLTGVKALDDYTLQVTLRYPYADLPAALANCVAAPVPMDYIATLGKTAAARNKAFGEHPVGDGPCRLQSWDHGAQIVLVPNPDFWDASQAAWVAEIDLPIYSDVAREWADFGHGDLDFAAVPSGQVSAAEAQYGTSSDGYTVAPGAQTLLGPGDNTLYVSFNCKKAPFTNADVRRAFSLAIDRQAIVTSQTESGATVATDVVPPCLAGHQADAWAYSHHDLTAAKALLAKAGHAGGAGLPTITYSYNSESLNDPGLAKLVRSQLGQLGVTVKLEGYPWDTYIGRLGAGKFMLARTGWMADYAATDNFLYPLFESSQSAYGSYSFYSNTSVDAALAAARATTDDAARVAMEKTADQLIGNDAPVILLYYRAVIPEFDYETAGAAGATRLRDAVLAPDVRFDFTDVWLADGDQAVPSVSSLISSTDPLSSHWYSDATPSLRWTGSASLTRDDGAAAPAGYAYSVDHNRFAFPARTLKTTQESVTLPHTADGVWYFHLRAQGSDGQWGPVRSYALRIDTHAPRTVALAAATVAQGATARLKYEVSDPKPNGGSATVKIVIKNAQGHAVKTLALGKQVVDKSLVARFRCKLAKGSYRFYVHATDAAGNVQVKAGSAKLTVK